MVNPNRTKRISDESLDKILEDVRQKLREGYSSKAKERLTDTLENYKISSDYEALFDALLSYSLETMGRYDEAFAVIDKYDNEKLLEKLEPENQVRVLNQLAIALNNTNEQPKAIALLNFSLEKAEQEKLVSQIGPTAIAMARVYRRLNEFPVAREHAKKALDIFRERGDWRGMADAYHTIAMTHYQQNDATKALENFDLAIKIVGERTAPFLLGKLYSDMSGAYYVLRKPHDGISCLEKSIEFFSKTEHKVQTVAAYNNLGMNQMILGSWESAGENMMQALKIAKEVDHAHIAGILDSLAELNLLRGETEEAIKLVEEGISIARSRKKEWYEIQAMRTLARCYVANGRLDDAISESIDAIEMCETMGESQFAAMTRLVLAEAQLKLEQFSDFDDTIDEIEESDPSADFFVLGEIQRLKGIRAAKSGNKEQAIHHFSRSLTIFESSEDIYNVALANLNIGEAYINVDKKKATRALVKASEVFRKLGIARLHERSEELIDLAERTIEHAPGESSARSQLLMQRLAEATASRELLFRELVAILQGESKARRIMIAEENDQGRLFPFIAHGYSAAECTEIVDALKGSSLSEYESIGSEKNARIFSIKTPNAPAAVLAVYPKSGAVLKNGSPLEPLLRVVELGMDVCALRDTHKTHLDDSEVSPFSSQSLMPGFIHSSAAMTELVEEVYRIRSSDVTVLVTGESGTGKELVSRAIHTVSNRKDEIFVPFNCTAVPKELAEGHLFGYKKGAYTGATQDSPGTIRTADGGTLFLDEIGDLPLDVQPKLLRFLQEGEVQPLGEKKPIQVDVRIIAATNMDLEKRVSEGLFREDLYYRLNVIRLRVPPLRERRSEIEPIVNYYVNHYSTRFNKKGITITPQTIDLLMVCDWEGNVRQLCNEVQRIVARASDGDVITPEDISPELNRNATPLRANDESVSPIMPQMQSGGAYSVGSAGTTLEEAVTELERQMIIDSLRRNEDNISRVAKELGLTRRGLYLKIQ